MAVGAILKKPAVVETPQGDTIGIRQMMFYQCLMTTGLWMGH